MPFYFAPARFTANTAANGQAALSIKIPGTFSGITPATAGGNGRFVRAIEIWADAPSPGDFVTGLRLEDTDQLLAQVPDPLNPGGTVGQRPGYPVIFTFGDIQAAGQGGGVAEGSYLHASKPTLFTPVGEDGQANQALRFVPSGLYIKGVFKTTQLVQIGQGVRANFNWAAWSPN